MALEQPFNTITLVAGEDLSSKQFRFMSVNTSGQAVGASSAGARCVGVLQNNPKSGEEATIMVNGITKIDIEQTTSTGNASVPGYVVASDANGRAVANISASALNAQYVLGVSLETVAASTTKTRIGTMLLMPGFATEQAS